MGAPGGPPEPQPIVDFSRHIPYLRKPHLASFALTPSGPADIMVYQSPDALDFHLNDLPVLPRPRRVVLTTPNHFDVEYVINPHMSDNVGAVNTEVAFQQWKAIRATYTALDLEPVVMNGQSGLPDMVFCANQTLPYYEPKSDTRGVVLSRMHSEHREAEVPYYKMFFENEGYDIQELPENLDADFEGMGDALWHPGRRLLWGGHGYRTNPDAYEALSELLDVPVVLVRLVDPDYYHLDTCLCPLNSDHALAAPKAFDDTGWGLVNSLFDTVIEVPDHEARHQFACNAHSPDGKHVLIQEGCEQTTKRLRLNDFVPVELDTSEFLKAGGSVFCMKQMVW